MKKFAFFLVLIFPFISCIRVNQNPVPNIDMTIAAETEGLFIHVKQGADHPQEVLMALSMANKFSLDYDVLMYFDIKGIEMVTKDAPNLKMDPFGSSDDLFNNLVDKGVTIFACPTCMKVDGIKPSDLRGGVKLAEEDMFFDFTDGRILSIEY